MPQTLIHLITLFALLNLAGCGKSPAADPPTEAPPTQNPSPNLPAEGVTPPPEEPRHLKPQQPPTPDWQNPDESVLKQHGIIRLNSERLILYTDLPAVEAAPLLPLADQFLRIVNEFLGPPAPTLVSDSRPIVAYLMADQEKFESLHLLPERIPPFHPGWHLARAVWMKSQKQPYYQRHLLFHELSHAALNTRVPRGLPPWFEEGVAELLATHRLKNDTIEWAGIPNSLDEFDGWGRIKEVREALKQAPVPTLEEIGNWSGEKYITLESYAWSWAICFFLAKHPQHSADFHRWIETRLTTNHPLPPPWTDWSPEEKAEWYLFAEEIDYGLDLDAWAIKFPAPASEASLQNFPIPSNRGWQSTGFNVKAEYEYAVTPAGEISLDKTNPHWTSTPSGISIHYASGQPLGRLLGRLLTRDTDGGMHFGPMIPIGVLSNWNPPGEGLLFLRINDLYGDLANNSGEYSATIVPKK